MRWATWSLVSSPFEEAAYPLDLLLEEPHVAATEVAWDLDPLAEILRNFDLLGDRSPHGVLWILLFPSVSTQL